LAKTIGSYKGLWNKAKDEAQNPLSTAAPATAVMPAVGVSQGVQHENAAVAPSASRRSQDGMATPNAGAVPAHAAAQVAPSPGPAATEGTGGPAHASSPESAEQLAHRYRLLVLREHRYKLGRDLLEAGSRDPWIIAFESIKSLGRSFRPWAHARIFALGCYLAVEMSPDILKQLRHPLRIGRYKRSMFGLWRLLEILAQKTGQKPVSRFFFRLFYLCPPLGIFIYERQLQAVLRQSQGPHAVMAPVMTNASQGQ
jgi:hypothetical protein